MGSISEKGRGAIGWIKKIYVLWGKEGGTDSDGGPGSYLGRPGSFGEYGGALWEGKGPREEDKLWETEKC